MPLCAFAPFRATPRVGARRRSAIGGVTATLAVCGLSGAPTPASAQATPFSLQLSNDFIGRFHNRVTMDVQLRVIGPQIKAHSNAKDGEVHISGVPQLLAVGGATAPPLGFAAVAEILHAKQFEGPGGLLKFIESQSQAGQPVRMTGVWRLWGEHGEGDFMQGTFPDPGTWNPKSNPPHVFELHPLTALVRGGQSVSFLKDFKPLGGFPDGAAAQRSRSALGFLERTSCKITPGAQSTTLSGDAQRYNFFGFVARNVSQPVAAAGGDGSFATADLFDAEGKGPQNGQPAQPFARGVRLVFVKGTPPADALAQLGPTGRALKLTGFARMDLSVFQKAVATGQTYQGKIPYEVIVTWLRP
jgi:hypothetical protein